MLRQGQRTSEPDNRRSRTRTGKRNRQGAPGEPDRPLYSSSFQNRFVGRRPSFVARSRVGALRRREKYCQHPDTGRGNKTHETWENPHPGDSRCEPQTRRHFSGRTIVRLTPRENQHPVNSRCLPQTRGHLRTFFRVNLHPVDTPGEPASG